jgi:hypothetical protein
MLLIINIKKNGINNLTFSHQLLEDQDIQTAERRARRATMTQEQPIRSREISDWR